MKNRSNKFESGAILEILRVALPLMIASSGVAIKVFTDRVMLAHYDGLALAASLSAGVIWYTLFSFWLGSVNYVSSFVAQYIGANKEKRVGIVVWQGLFLSLIGGAFIGTGVFWGEWFFNFLGHDPAQIAFEIPYFQIMCGGTVFFVMTNTLMTFWSGRGKTWMVTVQELLSTSVNVVVNYVLIFGDDGLESIGLGRWGVEEMGITGAAIGTIVSGFCGFLFSALMFFRKKHRVRYNTLPKKLFFISLFKRVVRFGMPSGVQLCLDVTSFGIFIHLLALMGNSISIASTIAFTFNAVMFIPVMSIGITSGIFVGQGIGSENIKLAKRATKNCFFVMLGYVSMIAVVFLIFPREIMEFFPLVGVEDVEKVYIITERMLHYIIVFFTFDGILILFSGAIKGAGDTKFSMYVGTGMSWAFFAIPSYIAVSIFDAGPWVLWKILVTYTFIAGGVFYIRYRGGKWEKMRIIE